MSDKKFASGAAWSDAEKIAYLLVLCENEGKIDGKVANAPIPAGRTVISCKKLILRLKEKHKDDIEKIKAGQPIVAATAAGGDGEGTPGRKRKSKAEGVSNGNDNGDNEGSPTKKKKAGGRKKTTKVPKEEDEIKEEESLEEEITE